MKKRGAGYQAACSGGFTGRQLKLVLTGRLDAAAVSGLWPEIQTHLRQKGIESIQVDGAGIDYCDGAGIGLLVYIRLAARRLNAELEFQELKSEVSEMLDLYPPDRLAEPDAADTKNSRDLVEQIGKAAWSSVNGLKEHISFLGELALGLGRTLIHPGGIRAKDFLVVTEASGPQALPIIGMLGFLVGLILAFQGAVLMAQFGAEIYIADFVGKSVAVSSDRSLPPSSWQAVPGRPSQRKSER